MDTRAALARAGLRLLVTPRVAPAGVVSNLPVGEQVPLRRHPVLDSAR